MRLTLRLARLLAGAVAAPLLFSLTACHGCGKRKDDGSSSTSRSKAAAVAESARDAGNDDAYADVSGDDGRDGLPETHADASADAGPDDYAPPPADAALHVAAVRVREGIGHDGLAQRVALADLGSRLVVYGASLLAHADGNGPLVAAKKTARPLPEGQEHVLVGIAGTHPGAVVALEGKHAEARGVQFAFTAHRYDAESGFAPLPGGIAKNEYPSMVVAYGPSAVLVAATVFQEDVIAAPSGAAPSSATVTIDASGTRGTPALEPGFRIIHAAATPSRHTYVLGSRKSAPGVWVARIRAGAPASVTTYEQLPGSGACTARSTLSVYTTPLAAAGDERAFVQMSDAECLKKTAGRIYEMTSQGLAPVKVSNANGDPARILAAGKDGTLWLATNDAVLVRAPSGTVREVPVVLPDGMKACDARQIVVRSSGDTWATFECRVAGNEVDVVARLGRQQKALELPSVTAP